MTGKLKTTLMTGIFALPLFFAVSGASAQDAEAEKQAFRKCQVCHTVEEGNHRIGPSLYNVFGRTPGTVEGFRYSSAMTEFGEAGNVWDEETLDKYLQNPRGVVPGTRMAFPGVRSEEERQNLIAYLKTLSEE